MEGYEATQGIRGRNKELSLEQTGKKSTLIGQEAGDEDLSLQVTTNRVNQLQLHLGFQFCAPNSDSNEKANQCSAINHVHIPLQLIDNSARHFCGVITDI